MSIDTLGPSCEDAILEFRRIGHTVKVSAVDPVSQLEVSIVAPASCSEREMTEAALRKLRYVLSQSTWRRR